MAAVSVRSSSPGADASYGIAAASDRLRVEEGSGNVQNALFFHKRSFYCKVFCRSFLIFHYGFQIEYTLRKVPWCYPRFLYIKWIMHSNHFITM